MFIQRTKAKVKQLGNLFWHHFDNCVRPNSSNFYLLGILLLTVIDNRVTVDYNHDLVNFKAYISRNMLRKLSGPTAFFGSIDITLK